MMSAPDPGEAPVRRESGPKADRGDQPPLRLPPPYFRVWAPLVLGACLAVLAFITGRLLKYW